MVTKMLKMNFSIFFIKNNCLPLGICYIMNLIEGCENMKINQKLTRRGQYLK